MSLSNIFDFFAVAILLLCILTAFYRGFVKDFSTFFKWVLSAIFTIILLPYVHPLFVGKIGSIVIASIIISVVLLTIFLIILSLLFNGITNNIALSMDPIIDRVLGLAFGTFKGIFIVSMIYISIVAIYRQIYDEKEKRPVFIEKSATGNFIDAVSDFTEKLIPDINLDDFVGEVNAYSKFRKSLIQIFTDKSNWLLITFDESLSKKTTDTIKLLPESYIQKIYLNNEKVIDSKEFNRENLNSILRQIDSAYREADSLKLINKVDDYSGEKLDENWQKKDFNKMQRLLDDK